MIKNTLIILTLLLLNSCSNGYEFWNLSKFNIDKNALQNQEEINVIYSSRGPDLNKDKEYYYHMIVVSKKSGDTINVLTPFNTHITSSDKTKTFNFISSENPMYGIMKLDGVEINKVARDPNFDKIADNNFPAVIGLIGETE